MTTRHERVTSRIPNHPVFDSWYCRFNILRLSVKVRRVSSFPTNSRMAAHTSRLSLKLVITNNLYLKATPVSISYYLRHRELSVDASTTMLTSVQSAIPLFSHPPQSPMMRSSLSRFPSACTFPVLGETPSDAEDGWR